MRKSEACVPSHESDMRSREERKRTRISCVANREDQTRRHKARTPQHESSPPATKPLCRVAKTVCGVAKIDCAMTKTAFLWCSVRKSFRRLENSESKNRARSDEDRVPRDKDRVPSDVACGFDNKAPPPHHEDAPRRNKARLRKLGQSLRNEQSLPLEPSADELRDQERRHRRSARQRSQWESLRSNYASPCARYSPVSHAAVFSAVIRRSSIASWVGECVSSCPRR
jgi:hypothetical protein